MLRYFCCRRALSSCASTRSSTNMPFFNHRIKLVYFIPNAYIAEILLLQTVIVVALTEFITEIKMTPVSIWNPFETVTTFPTKFQIQNFIQTLNKNVEFQNHLNVSKVYGTAPAIKTIDRIRVPKYSTTKIWHGPFLNKRSTAFHFHFIRVVDRRPTLFCCCCRFFIFQFAWLHTIIEYQCLYLLSITSLQKISSNRKNNRPWSYWIFQT